MKKTFALLLAALMMLSLFTACGGSSGTSHSGSSSTKPEHPAPPTHSSEAPSESTEGIKDLNLEEIYAAIVATVSVGQEELIMFPESSPELIENFYPGLTTLSLNQQVFYMPPIAGWASEIMLVEAADKANAEKAADIFQARIDMGADTKDYPETAVAWSKNAKVQRYGNYVAMIALPEGYTIPENVFALEPAATTPDAGTQTTEQGTETSVNDLDGYAKCYLEKAKELAAANEKLRFSLVRIDEDDIPELVADNCGYSLSVYTYNQTTDELVTIIDQWLYGAAGNPGYEYSPSRNIIRNEATEQAGAVTYYSYYMMDRGKVFPYFGGIDLYALYFEDKNGNGTLDDNESYSEQPVAYFVDSQKVSAEEFAGYQLLGDYEPLTGVKTIAGLELELRS